MRIDSYRLLLGGGAALVIAGSIALAGMPTAPAEAASKNAGLGPTSGLLPRDHLTVESAIQVDLSKETVRLPLYKGKANGETVWYVLLDASDQGIAHDLGVNYAPKLGNIGIGCPECVQTVTLDSPTPDAEQVRAGGRRTSRARRTSARPAIAEPGPTASRWRSFQPGAVAGPGYSPFIRIAGLADASTARRSSRPATARSTSSTTRTPADRVLGVHIAGAVARPGSSPSRGSTCCSSRASTPASRSSTSRPTPASP